MENSFKSKVMNFGKGFGKVAITAATGILIVVAGVLVADEIKKAKGE